MTARRFPVLHRSSPNWLGIRGAAFRSTQMGHTLQLTVTAGITKLVLLSFANPATLTNYWIGQLYSS